MATKAVAVSNQVLLHVSPQFIKRLPDPHSDRRWSYVGTIPALEAAKLLRGNANPREANLKSKVSEEIRSTIYDDPQEFHLRNRGLIVSTPDANLNTDTRTLTLENPRVEVPTQLWGIVDGGHTHDVIAQVIEAASSNGDAVAVEALKDTWVDIKIRVGLTADEIISTAAAVNTSAQLRPWTLANFRGELQLLHQMVAKSLPELEADIAFKENEINEATGSERSWDVLDLLQRMTLLNAALFPGFDPAKHPVVAYASKSKVLQLYLEQRDTYKAMSGIIADAFRMPAIVEAKIAGLSKVHGNMAFVRKAKQSEVDPALTGKYAAPRKYRIDNAVLFPVTAAIRPLIEQEGPKLQWSVDPSKFLDENVEALFQTFLSFYKQEVEDKTAKASLSGMGKDIRLWQILHAKVLAILAKPKKK